MQKDDKNSIVITGARVHNLKNISLTIPHNKLVVITGLSGSGKSSLAFDTLFAEGQRRYVESLSAYARQFLGRINKPDVDDISGIAPAIAIQQKVSSRNPRSTVGTTTEIYDYLKLLFARIGHIYSPVTGEEVKIYQVSDVVDYIRSLGQGSRVIVASEVHPEASGSLIEKMTLLLKDGFDRLFVKGEIMEIEELLPRIEQYRAEDIRVVIDRVAVDKEDEEQESRLGDSVQTAMSLGNGKVSVIEVPKGKPYAERSFSSGIEEPDGVHYIQPNEHLFSFNSPLGACSVCEGYGKVTGIDEDLVVPDKNKTLYEYAIACWRGDTMKWWKEQVIKTADKSGFPIHRPYYKLTEEQRRMLWKGTPWFEGIDGFFAALEKEKYKIQYRVLIARYTGKRLCPECNGGRLKKEAMYVKINGMTIVDMVRMPVSELYDTVRSLSLAPYEEQVARRILVEITNRLQYLMDVGLEYLTLDRLSNTLSGGESQRINLATSLGSSLVGSMYILDEPSIGLHPRDTQRLIKVLEQLRDLGNTVIVVEHDEEIMNAADMIIDIGPRAGVHGGEVVFRGDRTMLADAKNSLTADYLTHRLRIERPAKPRRWRNSILVKGARENNLKNIDVRIPLGVMTCVTGVSGSGKSSLVKTILYPALNRYFNQTGQVTSNFDGLAGDLKMIKGVEMVDQNPIGRSSRSNPVTYIKAYDEIRRLFSEQPAAKVAGYTPSHFSFNIAGGRCEECQGEGVIRVEMQFMADIEMVCDSCGGRRFKDEILQVRYRERSIDQILDMSVEEAVAFFGEDDNPLCRKIVEKLSALQDVGLGYVKLGQSSSTLSGGESQRVKLASFLQKENSMQPLLFIFDEPTTGLHFHDIKKLLASFDALLDKGHTIVVVEHNMEVVKCADWVVDLGEEGGAAGGNLVFEGTVDELVKNGKGYTANFLGKNLSD